MEIIFLNILWIMDYAKLKLSGLGRSKKMNDIQNLRST